MAKIEIIVAKLPSLIANRADSQKVETAVRYVGDIIFEASQNPTGDKGKWLASILAGAKSPVEAGSREMILTLLRDGYLDRYADYSAWKDIASVAGFSSGATNRALNNGEPQALGAPKVVALTKMLTTASGLTDTGDESGIPKPNEGFERSALTPGVSDPTPKARPANPIVSSPSTANICTEPRGSNGRSARQRAAGSASDRKARGVGFLEIKALENTARNPVAFAANLQRNAVNGPSRAQFPCLTGFRPNFSANAGSVRWVNPVTGDSFVDHGDRLTSGKTGRLSIRAMVELARAENWTKAAVQGSARLRAFTETAGAELDRTLIFNFRQHSASGVFAQAATSSTGFLRYRRLYRAAAVSAALIAMAGAGFAVMRTYVTSQRLQTSSQINGPVESVASNQGAPVEPRQRTGDAATPLASPGIVLSPAATGCSLATARQLNIQYFQSRGRPNIQWSVTDVLCEDYVRFGVMIFEEDGGSDAVGYAIYREQKPGHWARLRRISLDNSERITTLLGGELLVQNEWSSSIYRWNGNDFAGPEETQYVTYWNGNGWTRITEETASADNSETCSFRVAKDLLVESAESLSLVPAGSNDRPVRFACADFTGTQLPQIAFSIPEWPCHACNTWLIFEKRPAALIFDKRPAVWTLVFRNQSALCIEPERRGAFELVTEFEQQPRRESYGWDGGRFVLSGSSIAASDSCRSKDAPEKAQADGGRTIGKAWQDPSDVIQMPPPKDF